MDQAEHVQAERSGQAVGADLGALLARNEQERHALIDGAIFAVLRERQESGRGPALSTQVARALEERGAVLRHVEVVDGLARLFRRGIVSCRSTGSWTLADPASPAGAPPASGPRPLRPHAYPGVAAVQAGGAFFTSECAHGCGCWMGDARSGGPEAIDPCGECPKAPGAEVAA